MSSGVRAGSSMYARKRLARESPGAFSSTHASRGDCSFGNAAAARSICAFIMLLKSISGSMPCPDSITLSYECVGSGGRNCPSGEKSIRKVYRFPPLPKKHGVYNVQQAPESLLYLFTVMATRARLLRLRQGLEPRQRSLWRRRSLRRQRHPLRLQGPPQPHQGGRMPHRCLHRRHLPRRSRPVRR